MVHEMKNTGVISAHLYSLLPCKCYLLHKSKKSTYFIKDLK